MHGVQSTAQHQPADLPLRAFRKVRSFLTPKRVTYFVAGALVCISIAVMAHSNAVHHHTDSSTEPPANTPSPEHLKTPTNSSVAPGSSSSSTTDFSSTSTGSNSTETHLTVNGREVAVPKNSATEHTITNSDGTTTTVNTSNSSSDTSSSSNISVHTESNGTSSGGNN